MKSQKTRKTMKRIAASLLVLCLIFTMVGTGTLASYAYANEGGYVYGGPGGNIEIEPAGGDDDGTTQGGTTRSSVSRQ